MFVESILVDLSHVQQTAEQVIVSLEFYHIMLNQLIMFDRHVTLVIGDGIVSQFKF